MLLSRAAITDVVGLLTSADFYRPAHGLIYDAILDRYGRDEPADAISVAKVLAGAGSLDDCGCERYLHTLLTGAVPGGASPVRYARTVAEAAQRRRS